MASTTQRDGGDRHPRAARKQWVSGETTFLKPWVGFLRLSGRWLSTANRQRLRVEEHEEHEATGPRTKGGSVHRCLGADPNRQRSQGGMGGWETTKEEKDMVVPLWLSAFRDVGCGDVSAPLWFLVRLVGVDLARLMMLALCTAPQSGGFLRQVWLSRPPPALQKIGWGLAVLAAPLGSAAACDGGLSTLSLLPYLHIDLYSSSCCSAVQRARDHAEFPSSASI